MTLDINVHYGVTIRQTQAGNPFVATGEIFSRKTMQDVGIRVRGEGRTWTAAAKRAMEQARAECPDDPVD